ncbi:hypothetical protein RND81_02G237900 [Saponaria officinalis]|uniref:endo-polygalacturonase n=1 Tax=Saponaria officinalis TaxID=3572 RepID=A0AAW1MX12_SAPOF
MGIFTIILVSLLMIINGTAEKLHDAFGMIGELGSLNNNNNNNEDDEDDGIEAVEMSSSWRGKRCVVNVDSFGAVGDGISDDTQAFIGAWNKACSMQKSVLLVPKRRRYVVNATIFNGPCVGKLIVKIEGTIIAPAKIKEWDPKLTRIWLAYNNLTSVVFKGNGVIDGSGAPWWAASCKRNKSLPCTKAPTSLTIDNSSDIHVRDLTIRNSQQFHFTISRSHSVSVSNVLVTAPADSPNTDGIHILNSTKVVLKKCKIGTGDDCISIIAGSSNIKMKSITCGPGHGISIGSLGKDNATDFVKKIHLDGAFFKNTTNGVRIKSWQGGSGYAKEIKFENVIMEDVKNPIIIDQFYCDSTTPCANQTSAVKISDIKFKNIVGFTQSEVAMKFACSDTVPCKNIHLINIALISKNTTADTFCNSATVSEFGVVVPPVYCLLQDDA